MIERKNICTQKLEENKKKNFNFSKQNVKRLLREDNLLKSQQLVKYVLNHTSMPKSRYISSYGTIVDYNVVTHDESNVDTCDKKIYKHIPFKRSLGLYLSHVKKALQGGC